MTLSSWSENYVVIHVAPGFGSLSPQPVDKNGWMPNDATDVCLQTGTKFKLTVRRSHCRNCGEIFVKDCLNNLVMLKGLPKRDKICDACYGLVLQEDQVLVVDHKIEFLYQ